jgi:hypothetical protein
MIYHVEVHSRDRQVEHYIVRRCETRQEVIDRIREFYMDKHQRIGLWEREDDRLNLQLPYLIFDVKELPDDDVIYISGEYRSQFPI